MRYYLGAVLSIGLAIGALEVVGPTVNGATAAQVLLLVILLDARFLGGGPAIAASALAGVGFLHYFVTPGGFAYGDPNDWAALFSFVTIAIVGGELAVRAERRAAEAQRGRQEIERLYQELQAAFDRASEAEAARRNERLKAALLDALTHNLRTPLTAIKAAVTALIGVEAWTGATPISSEGERELLQIIDEETDRLNRFIEGLSNAGSGDAQPLSVAAVDAGDIVRDALARAEPLVRDHRVVVSVNDVPPLSVDRPSLTEVLYILIDNATKYSGAGTAVHIAAEREDQRHVRLTVTDEGPGIPPEHRDRVFEKFYRIPHRQARDPRRAGIGLGLSIARRLVEAQAGRIWIDMPPSGQGTTMALSVPVAAQQDAAAQPPAVAAGINERG